MIAEQRSREMSNVPQDRLTEVLANFNEDPDKIIEKEVVQPDSRLDHLLDSPREAFEEIFGDCERPAESSISDPDWRNHVFCQKTVIAELCAWQCPARYINILLEELS